MAVARSTDRGETWDPGTPLDKGPYTGAPGANGNKFCALPDGTVIVAVTLRNGDGVRDRDGSDLPLEERGIYDYIYRSTDGGSTWGDRTLIVDHCSETSFLSSEEAGSWPRPSGSAGSPTSTIRRTSGSRRAATPGCSTRRVNTPRF